MESVLWGLAGHIPWSRVTSFATGQLERMAETTQSKATLASFLGMACVLAVEIVALGWDRSSLKRFLRPSRTTFADMFFFAGKLVGYFQLVVLVFSLGLSALPQKIADAFFGVDLLARLSGHPVLQALLFLLVRDFFGYWTHRGRHQLAWWWELHKYHHSAEEFNGVTTARRHPLDHTAIVLTNAIPVALLGGTIEQYFVLSVVLGAHACLVHSMLDWKWGWFGKYVLYSPVGHRIHHSPLLVHWDRNFGNLFPIWDHVFGTWYGGDVVNQRVGVDDNYYRDRSLIGSIVEGTRRAALASVGRKVPRAPEPARETEPLGGA